MKSVSFQCLYIIALCFVTSLLHAQRDSLLKVYNKEVISYGTVFIKDGEKMRFNEVQGLLLKFPDSGAEFLMYKKKSTVSRVLMISSLILVGAALSERNTDLGYVFVLSGIGVGIPATILGRKSYRHLQNSIWLYNRDILVQKY
jgi:hypothetical protein